MQCEQFYIAIHGEPMLLPLLSLCIDFDLGKGTAETCPLLKVTFSMGPRIQGARVRKATAARVEALVSNAT